jgi:cytoskeletal protein RodZ
VTTDRTQEEPTVGTVEAREALAAWLRQGRTQRKLSLEDVAKVTKIQPRILDKLERGELEGLPADVFVRGFVRSFAKCVGLDEGEAVIRYGACQSAEAAASPTARALVESMGLTKKKAEPVIEAVSAPVIEAPAPVVPTPVAAVEAPIIEAIVEIAAAAKGEPPSSKKKRSRKRKNKKSKQSTNLAVAEDDEPAPPQRDVIMADGAVESIEPQLAEGSQRISTGKIQAVVVEEIVA